MDDEQSVMTLRTIRDLLEAEVLCGEELLDKTVSCGCSADLMSDMLAFGGPHAVLLTGQADIQAVRTAQVAGSIAVVFVRGKRPAERAIALAKQIGMPLMSSKCLMFEASGRLYEKGLRS
jgi:predicted transcriptional regulator